MARNQDVPADLKAQAQYWWVMLLEGLVAILVGWALLKNPLATTISLVVVLGLYWLIAGIVNLVASLFEIGHEGSRWGLKLLGGLIGIIAGLIVLNNPVLTGIFTPVFLMYFVAFAFIINGIIHMTIGNQIRSEGHYDWSWGSFFLGLFYLIFGFVLLAAPTIVSTASLILVAGILAIIGGIGMIILSFQIRSLAKKAT